MSDAKNDGGPAFPVPTDVSNGEELYLATTGMSLRDWFAGRATQADIEIYLDWHRANDGEIVPRYTREQAKYRYADAMLEARKGGTVVKLTGVMPNE